MTGLKKILIVDDDPDILEQVGLILKTNGFEVFSACSAADAEEAMITTRPDVAIIDLMMEEPDSGFVLCHQLKKVYPNVPVIMLTAVRASAAISFDDKNAEAKSWVKVDCMLDKPVRPEELLNAVKRQLEV